MTWGFFIKLFLIYAVAFIGGAHIGMAQNPDYADDDLGPKGHWIVAYIFIGGGLFGLAWLILDVINIMSR